MTCASGRGIRNLMPIELRQTGIEALGEMPWGTHLCHFYETKQDLLDILIPYFKAGLESNEFCLWVIPRSLSVAEATRALEESVPEFEKHLANRSIELLVTREAPDADSEPTLAQLTRYIAGGSLEI